MIRFQDLQMSHEAKNKWAKATIDDQSVLQMTFSDILRRPELVAYYEDLSVTLGGILFEFFFFRIGYAIFFLMMMEGLGEFIVLDFGLQDGDSARLDDRMPLAALPLPAPPPP
jgi:hypothetical protein